jgi:NADP-dependent 3-hydroxy acid dehydrogenase YdfG
MGMSWCTCRSRFNDPLINVSSADKATIAQRKFLVTGASRGIGRAIATRLLDAGAPVVGVGRDFTAWRSPPAGFVPVTLDLARLDALPQQLQALVKAHADLSGVVANAGGGRFGHLEQFSPVQIRTLVDINLTQHLLVARAVLPLLKRRGRGDLIFIGSEAALRGGAKGAVYAACKFGLRGLAQSLRQECAASGVRVGIINPGMVDTDFFDGLGFRPGADPHNHLRPGDVAELVYAMLSAPPGTVVDEISLSPLKKVILFEK